MPKSVCLPIVRFMWLMAVLVASQAAQAAPVHLHCEYRDNPLGIDAAIPRLSWQSDNPERNWRQTAYQIVVTSHSEASPDKPTMWDSGKQAGSDSVGIAYGGPNLHSGTRCEWRVRVWDADGKPSVWSKTAWWEMGLLGKTDWKARWITRPDPDMETDRAGIRWIGARGQDALNARVGTKAIFRLSVNLSQKPQDAALFITARGELAAQVNGQAAGAKKDWFSFDRQDVTDLLKPGQNIIEVMVTATPLGFGSPVTPGAGGGVPTALAGLLKVTGANHCVTRFPTDAGWEARLAEGGEWKPANIVATLAGNRMGYDPGPLPQPASLFRRGFTLSKRVRSARVYATALGSYRLFLNGQRVGQDALTPEFTDYRKRVLYQTYDVTSLIHPGENAFGALLGDGWFGSGLSWTGQRFFFLPPPTRLLAQMRILYTDGSAETIGTDAAWKTAPAPILHSEIYAGEVYDARREQPGWNCPGFDEKSEEGWSAAAVADTPAVLVTAQSDTPVQITQTRKPRRARTFANGATVYDMGQNMVGWARLNVSGPAGTRVRLRFAEIVNPDGTLYRDNLRNANATDTYVLRGNGPETYAPHFTFHGFRYVEVTGTPGKPMRADIVGQVVSSVSLRPSGTLRTSSELVNRMWQAGLWGQRGNFLSVPTDCPQRDERLGWMGDAQVFWRVGSYNFDIAAFAHKWMQDVTDAQAADGAFTSTAPSVPMQMDGNAGWGDAGVIVPWTTWLQYGDKSILEENWDAMQRWMAHVEQQNPTFLRTTGFSFGDWLAVDDRTPNGVVNTAYWALLAERMAQMAGALGKEAEAKRYAALYDNIRAAFQKAYIRANGEVSVGTQTCYVMTLIANLAPKEMEPALVSHLVSDIEAHKGHLTTGFLGTPFLLFALADYGRTDVAYRLLLTETYPSWGYMLSKGATTWWERWNSDMGDPAMNSFNHYAFGSVVGWVYRCVAGIDAVPNAPGFREIVIHPRLDDSVTQARGEYDSVYGKIVSDWKGTQKGPFTLNVTIPANTSATVFLPAIPNALVTESGTPITAQKQANAWIVHVGSGSYSFQVK